MTIKKILLNIFIKDITNIILSYVTYICSNCKRSIITYNLCRLCNEKFCKDCYLDPEFPSNTLCYLHTHFPWH